MDYEDTSRTASLPRQIGRYQVERVLGRGAMGTVYLATDPHIQRQVAMKTIHSALLSDTTDGADRPSGSELTERFLNEARAAGRLVHPHIVSVFDYGETDGVGFIALEYVPGETLAQRLARHARSGSAIPVLDALSWFAQLLDALSYAHELGVIHRDIKPANLLITPRGDCKVTDFGIAQLDTGRLTQAGMMIGTPSYMSPEQYAGGKIDARSDLFSAGVVLYEMLTGRCPFSGTSAAMMHQVINEMPPPPSSHVVDLPAELDAMTMKAIAKRPEQRFATALSWRNALLVLHDTLKDRLDPDHTVIAAKLPRQARPICRPASSPRLRSGLPAMLGRSPRCWCGAPHRKRPIHERSPRSWRDICPTTRLAANGAPCSSSIWWIRVKAPRFNL